MDEQPSLRVDRQLGQAALAIVTKLSILDKYWRIISTDKEVLIPLARMPSEEEIATLRAELPDFQITEYSFEKRESRPRNLADALSDKLPSHILANLPRAYDSVGDIAILELSRNLLAFGGDIGDAVKQLNPRYKTVLAKAGPVTDVFRVRDYTILTGGESTITEHSEYGCKFRLDPRKVYFSPRLSYERQRIASRVKSGEIVIDMFAGVGPFSIIIAVNKKVRVYGIDVNPEAISFMLQNIRFNNLRGKVVAILADSIAESVQLLSCLADRVIMNLPENCLRFIPQACSLLKPEGGTLHLYTFVSEKISLQDLSRLLFETVKSSGRRLVATEAVRTVKAVAPREWQLAFDIRVI